MAEDYYEVLGVAENATTKEIKEAFRALAFQFHPDRNKGNPEASDKMKAINEAYAVLSDPAKKREYDTLRQQFGSGAYSRFRTSYSEQDIFRGSDIHDVLEEMAKMFGFRGYEDIFKEFYGQGYRSFEFGRPGFFAKGFVFTGSPKKGGQPQSTLGKLSRFFMEKITGVALPQGGQDINDVIHLSPEMAQEGGPYPYFHRQKSKKLVVKIPPGVKDGQRIRLAAMGEDGKGGGAPGDLYLKVHIRKPLLEKVKGFLAGLRK